jgi:L-arabinose isomerase
MPGMPSAGKTLLVRALWLPRPDLKTAAAAWIYAGGVHHTSFSYVVNASHLQDFAGIEFLVIDENTRMEDFRRQLRWIEAVHH